MTVTKGKRFERGLSAKKAKQRAMQSTPLQRNKKHWTIEEIKVLTTRWGEFHPLQIAKRLKKTPEAVRVKAIKLKLGPPSRGQITIGRMVTETGYTTKALMNASILLGIKPRDGYRYEGRGKSWQFYTDEQFEQILDFVKKIPDGMNAGPKTTSRELWGIGTHPESCLCCKQTNELYLAKGLCVKCYALQPCVDCGKIRKRYSARCSLCAYRNTRLKKTCTA